MQKCTYEYFFRLQDLPPTPWKAILTSWPVWALIIVEAGHDWGGFTIVSDLPKYMSDVLHFSVAQVSSNILNSYRDVDSELFTNAQRVHDVYIFRTDCCRQYRSLPSGSRRSSLA